MMEAILIKREEETYKTQSLFETWVPNLINAPQPSHFRF